MTYEIVKLKFKLLKKKVYSSF